MNSIIWRSSKRGRLEGDFDRHWLKYNRGRLNVWPSILIQKHRFVLPMATVFQININELIAFHEASNIR